jgi:hypothetical protein
LYAIQHVQQRETTNQKLLAKTIRIVLYICVPGCVAKQAVNVAQLCSSCHTIAAWDAQQHNEREKKKQ